MLLRINVFPSCADVQRKEHTHTGTNISSSTNQKVAYNTKELDPSPVKALYQYIQLTPMTLQTQGRWKG